MVELSYYTAPTKCLKHQSVGINKLIKIMINDKSKLNLKMAFRKSLKVYVNNKYIVS